MQQALTKLNNDVQGVLSPNDGIASSVMAALKSQQLDGKVVITGQDATIAGLQSILQGTQAMTVFKPISLKLRPRRRSPSVSRPATRRSPPPSRRRR